MPSHKTRRDQARAVAAAAIAVLMAAVTAFALTQRNAHADEDNWPYDGLLAPRPVLYVYGDVYKHDGSTNCPGAIVQQLAFWSTYDNAGIAYQLRTTSSTAQIQSFSTKIQVADQAFLGRTDNLTIAYTVGGANVHVSPLTRDALASPPGSRYKVNITSSDVILTDGTDCQLTTSSISSVTFDFPSMGNATPSQSPTSIVRKTEQTSDLQAYTWMFSGSSSKKWTCSDNSSGWVGQWINVYRNPDDKTLHIAFGVTSAPALMRISGRAFVWDQAANAGKFFSQTWDNDGSTQQDYSTSFDAAFTVMPTINAPMWASVNIYVQNLVATPTCWSSEFPVSFFFYPTVCSPPSPSGAAQIDGALSSGSPSPSPTPTCSPSGSPTGSGSASGSPTGSGSASGSPTGSGSP